MLKILVDSSEPTPKSAASPALRAYVLGATLLASLLLLWLFVW